MSNPTSRTANASPAPARRGDSHDLRLVLFGMPAAGKSSLLGALARAAEDQQTLLGGKLIDESRGLADLSQQLYDTTPRRTPEEVVPYPIRYEPLPVNGHPKPGKPIDAVLMDCDGRVANDLIARKEQLDEASPEGSLTHEVLDADALILVVDASAPPAQVEADFAEFVTFVRNFERGRKQRAEVTGMPVFLVLTKCDLLARAGDSPADWMERIEQRKNEVDEHFRDFMAREEAALLAPAVPADKDEHKEEDKQEESNETAPAPFGRIDLHVWATAVKRPQLAGCPARPREPYGVAELFRQCLREAQLHRERTRRSDRWLGMVTLGMLGLLVLMLGLIVVFWVSNQSGHLKQLGERVEVHRLYNKDTTAAERLSGTMSDLKHKLSRLEEIRDDPLFGQLKDDQRAFVEERIKELKGYVEYLERIFRERDLPGEQSEEEIEARVARLKGDLAVPEEWKKTRAAEEHQLMLDRARELREGAEIAYRWYFQAAAKAAKLWASASDRGNWRFEAQKELDPANRPPFSETSTLSEPLGLTYATVLRYDRVARQRLAWQKEQERLSQLLDVLSALRVIPPSKERPALLEFLVDFTLPDAQERVKQLRQYYPDYETSFTLAALPDAIRPRVIEVANEQYQPLLRAGQGEVLRQLGGKEPKEGKEWEKLQTWLQSPVQLSSWRVLARVLRNFRPRPPQEDPVTELAKFLAQERFTATPRAFVLEIPERAFVEPNRNSPLTIARTRQGKRLLPDITYKLAGSPRVEGGSTIYRYEPATTEDRSFDFEPGDLVRAHLALSGNKERLSWMNSRSLRYTIERLSRPPRVEESDNPKNWRPIDGVILRAEPADGVPRVPDLLPNVPGE